MTGNVTLETRHEPIPNVRNRIGRSPGRKKNTVRYRRGYAVAVPESAPCVVSCQRYRNASAAAEAVAADTMHRYSSIADPLASDEDAVYCVPAQRRGCRSFFSAQSRHRRQKKTSPNAGRPNRPKTVNSKGASPPVAGAHFRPSRARMLSLAMASASSCVASWPHPHCSFPVCNLLIVLVGYLPVYWLPE